ncbi:hypothetical protein [Mycobacterium tuberculosis]|uniref:hypothetical protein n=1 Tax=Mycobacterium tuberculosis TaxID=1773 RepID=UPI00272CDC33|nr:hypothetical protein [Mycobacterium tuberculosis]
MATGTIRWHYQNTPNDGWDYDGVNEFVTFKGKQAHPRDHLELGFEEIDMLFLAGEIERNRSRLTKSWTVSQWAIAARRSGIASCSSARSALRISSTFSPTAACPCSGSSAAQAHPRDHLELGFEEIDMLFLAGEIERNRSRLTKLMEGGSVKEIEAKDDEDQDAEDSDAAEAGDEDTCGGIVDGR